MKLQERLIVGVPTLLFSFYLIAADAAGVIDIEKFGYAVIGGWIALLLNFYYRKDKKDSTNKT